MALACANRGFAALAAAAAHAQGRLVTGGLNNYQVAARMYISTHTVAHHLGQAFRKLQIASRVELARIVIEERRSAHDSYRRFAEARDRTALRARACAELATLTMWVSRAAHAFVAVFFFPQPGADTEALNASLPADDVATYGDLVRRTAVHVAELSRAANPDEHAATVVAALLPDQLRYRPGQPAHFAPGMGNGRGLHDDAFGTTLSLMVGRQLGITTSPYPVVPEFPHLAPAGCQLRDIHVHPGEGGSPAACARRVRDSVACRRPTGDRYRDRVAVYLQVPGEFGATWCRRSSSLIAGPFHDRRPPLRDHWLLAGPYGQPAGRRIHESP